MIRLERTLHASVLTVTMDRPDRRNALDAALVARLTDAVRKAGEDPTVRVIVLAGDGPVFSAGADLDALAKLQGATHTENMEDSRRLADLFEALLACPVPVIARVHGHAIAGGCGLVAACDLAIASENARFGFTEVRIGFVPAIVSVVLAGRVAGHRIRDLLLTGRLVDADEAARIGLVSRVVPSIDLDSAVADLALSIARETSREAVAATKRLLREAAGLEHRAAMDLAVRTNADARSAADCIAGVRAFLDRTDPPWKAGW